MYIKGAEENPWQLCHVPDQYKAGEMCDKAVKEDSSSLVCVLDWFITQGQIKILHDGYGDDGNNDIIGWHDGYQKRRAQKAQIECFASIKMLGLML